MIPTILLTGFLGAGKTTLLNRLIGHYRSKRSVLLINEFGSVGIDGTLLRQGNYEKVELNKGSLFCICIRTDFIKEVERIADRIKPDLLIIEATGLADTDEMEKMLSLPSLRNRIRLKACVCLVDATNFIKIRKYAKAPVSQVESADIVLLNKSDLVDNDALDKVKESVKSLAPMTPVIATKYADLDVGLLDNLDRKGTIADELPGSGLPDPFNSMTLESDKGFTFDSFNQFLDKIKEVVFRLKGFARIDGKEYIVDGTTEKAELKDALAHFNDFKTTTLVLIGLGYKKETILALFKDAARY